MQNNSDLLLIVRRLYIFRSLPRRIVGDQQEQAERFSRCSCSLELVDVSVFIEMCIGLQMAVGRFGIG